MDRKQPLSLTNILNLFKGMTMRKYTLPTGYLLVDEYSKGKLETLSIGDYGKHVNIKADFLGYSRELNGVQNTEVMPLSEKWVVTLSTQYGCVQKCTFCDVPNVKFRGNATMEDLYKQLNNAFSCFPDTNYIERLNIHFARMGEPVFNKDVLKFSRDLYKNKRNLNKRIETLHPVLTSSLPTKYGSLEDVLQEWCEIKNDLYNGQAGLQFSINSSSDEQRNEMFVGSSLSLEEISKIADRLPAPVGRKYCLNFAYATGFIIDGEKIADLFDQNKFMCKITPIHNNNACGENGIRTVDGYTSYRPYKEPEESLKKAGFDVLVFIPSQDEEDGIVTCGNAVLGGSEIKSDVKEVKVYRKK